MIIRLNLYIVGYDLYFFLSKMVSVKFFSNWHPLIALGFRIRRRRILAKKNFVPDHKLAFVLNGFSELKSIVL